MASKSLIRTAGAAIAVLLTLACACERDEAASSVVGRWELDKEKAYAAIIAKMTEEVAPPDGEMQAFTREHVEASYCNYEFRSDGTVTIDYRMSESSHGYETGTWEQAGKQVIVRTTQQEGTQAADSGRRVYSMQNGRLVWAQPGGLTWYLIRKPG